MGPWRTQMTHENGIYSRFSTPIPNPQSPAPIFEAAPHGPVAHPVTHENARAVSAVGIGIGVAIAIGRHFDIDSDSEPDTDSDPEIPSEHSIFEAAHDASAALDCMRTEVLPAFRSQSPTPSKMVEDFAERMP